jgi:hypothetical protein
MPEETNVTNSVETASAPLSRKIFTPARARCGPDFTSRGQRVDPAQLLKGPTETGVGGS